MSASGAAAFSKAASALGTQSFMSLCPLAQRPPSDSLRERLQGASASAQDVSLPLRPLPQQPLTPTCQLGDQESRGWEEASRLGSQLKDKLEEIQKRQHEANWAVSPLKAKVASLVRKCLERNRLITHLLQTLHAHGAADPLLSEVAQAVLDDVALAEYTASFLPSEVQETSRRLRTGSEKAAAVRAPNYLQNLQVDSVLQSSLHCESWPDPGTEWSAQMTRLDSPKPPLRRGPMRDPRACTADVAVESGLPAPRQPEKGRMSHPALPADGLPPAPEILSPARILAFYRELRESICGNSQVNKSLLEL
ncbi:uncharacterized protein C4orf50-like [Tamandua tetradactyla]|uniref:uncharacterized protein C4orf50-like n=1 Tax=Tamandua tetradactyla TaxID=48850 RepID=UPI0040544B78